MIWFIPNLKISERVVVTVWMLVVLVCFGLMTARDHALYRANQDLVLQLETYGKAMQRRSELLAIVEDQLQQCASMTDLFIQNQEQK